MTRSVSAFPQFPELTIQPHANAYSSQRSSPCFRNEGPPTVTSNASDDGKGKSEAHEHAKNNEFYTNDSRCNAWCNAPTTNSVSNTNELGTTQFIQCCGECLAVISEMKPTVIQGIKSCAPWAPICMQAIVRCQGKESFGEIGKAIGKDEIWTAALFYGQAKPAPQDLAKLSEALGSYLDGLHEAHLTWVSRRTSPVPQGQPWRPLVANARPWT
ncbi:hypothetical protein AG1IA_07183 [Rhizoctonia solani AG-1 IA]|uniref:Uncharacterized protein n=1 Tax=Thanatephorus cucumeris (strain AG1-IA) TaxID=983506 RepID=L8WPV9_THACA|nr:hypothetical protein AG1IA_07183 [Rhizoctonia solani AG-1 IA]